MSLNKNYLTSFSLFFLLCVFSNVKLRAQEQDSIWTETLDDVVITGQLNPQAVDKSVFEVKVITEKEIKRRAATTLADLLNQTLNISIVPNPSTGKSSLSLFGLDGQYFKILIDGVPMINEEGVGNNIDLSLINIDNVKRVEFVEGAMGVQYGANALSGILNIITKDPSTDRTTISVYAQEESIGSEYEWFDQGKHVQSVQVDHGFSEQFSASVSYNRNDFGGFWNDKKGEVYDKNDDRRGHQWLPKVNQNVRLALNYKPLDDLHLDYRFDYLTEDIYKYNETVSLNENPATQTQQPTAIDELYTNLRFMHNLNASGKIFGNKTFNFSASYQKQTKDLERYTYIIREDRKTNVNKSEYLEREVLFSRGFISNLLNSKKTSLQVGYELNLEQGQGSPFAMEIGSAEETSQRLNHYDFFASLEHQFSERFSVRPGARLSTSNLFNEQYMLSLSSRYKFDKGYQLRAVVGSSNRTPTYNELYTYFVDVNHDVQGNPDLNPEKGYSIFVHLKKHFQLSESLNLKSKLSASLIHVNDRIELGIASQSPLTYKYTNIDAFKTHGIYTENTLFYKNFQLNLGAAVQGVSKEMNSSESTANADYLYHFQMNANLNYEMPKIASVFTIYFKHIGQQYQFVEKENTQGDSVFERGKTEAYSWLDTSFKKSFFNDQWVATLGVRNLLDVSSIDTTATSGGTHSDAPSAQSIAYGRSYFLRLQYNLNL